MDLPSRCDYQRLFQVLGLDTPSTLPGLTKCPVCSTYNSLHVHRVNSTGVGYFCRQCGFIGDSIQLYKEAGKYSDLDTACTDMMSITGLLQGNLVDIRSNLVNYARVIGPERELLSASLNLGWSRLSNDLGDASNVIWELGLASGPTGASNLAPHFAILTPNELESVFDVDSKYLKRFKNKKRKLLCMLLFKDLITISGFLIIQSANNITEIPAGEHETIGLGFYLSFNKSARSTLVFDDPAIVSLVFSKYKADFQDPYLLYLPPSSSSLALKDIPRGRTVFVYSDFIKGMKACSNLDDSYIYTADEQFMYELPTSLSKDIEKRVQASAYSFSRAFNRFAEESSEMHILELTNNLSLKKEQIQRIINEATVEQKLRLEDLLVESKENQEIKVFDKIIVVKNGCWYHNEVLVSDCTFCITAVTHEQSIGSVAFGDIQYKGSTYSFTSPLKTICKDPISWLQMTLIKEGAGLPQINRKYKSLLYDIAISQHPPAASTTSRQLGWDTDTWVYPKFTIAASGFFACEPGQYLNSQLLNVNIPDTLTDNEIDDILCETQANNQFWAIISYLLYTVSALKYDLPTYHLCLVSDTYNNVSYFLDCLKKSIGAPDLNFNSARKGELDRQTLLASESCLPAVVDYSAYYRMPGLLSWLSKTEIPCILAAPKLDFLNFNTTLEFVYVNPDSLVSDGRYLNLFRYFWLRIQELLSNGSFPNYSGINVRSALQNIQFDCIKALSDRRSVKVPNLCHELTSNLSLKPLLLSNLEKFVATCMCWVKNGSLEIVPYLDNELPKAEDKEKIVYSGGQYLFPRDHILPLFVREGFLPPQSALIEKDLKACSNGEDFSFKLHTRHWWRVPFAEVAYHRESN